MPTNKNALIRLKHLDDLLSDRHHYYDIHDLTDIVNERLKFDGFKEVGQRTIEKDLIDLADAPFNAPIKRVRKDGRSLIFYGKRSFSIFKKEMSDEEEHLLSEVFNTIGQFDGLDNFKWLEDFKRGLDIEERPRVICFSNNPYMQNSHWLGTLFDNISNKVVIKLSYHTYADKETIKTIDFHPYLLKQYNDRWYVFGAADSDKFILNFALDRIDDIEPLPEKKFFECPVDIFERFDNIIGVSYYKDRPVLHIVFWVSDSSKDYVITKPIHRSQTLINGEEEDGLRKQYPKLESGSFFSIDCIENYELIRELCSYGGDLVVVEPTLLKVKIVERITKQIKRYSLE